MFICSECLKECKNKRSLSSHKWKAHTEAGKNHTAYKNYIKGTKIPWNKGLSKETDERIKNSSEYLSDLFKGKPGKPHTEKSRKKISDSMHKAHEEGRAWNIGKSRWNNKPSYPEKWFMQVIENELINKNYKREYPFHRFSLDFIWLESRKVIEIDGAQHLRFPEQKVRDNTKDLLLKNEGYQLLRADWCYICNNTKEFIETVKLFIDN